MKWIDIRKCRKKSNHQQKFKYREITPALMATSADSYESTQTSNILQKKIK